MIFYDLLFDSLNAKPIFDCLRHRANLYPHKSQQDMAELTDMQDRAQKFRLAAAVGPAKALSAPTFLWALARAIRFLTSCLPTVTLPTYHYVKTPWDIAFLLPASPYHHRSLLQRPSASFDVDVSRVTSFSPAEHIEPLPLAHLLPTSVRESFRSLS